MALFTQNVQERHILPTGSRQIVAASWEGEQEVAGEGTGGFGGDDANVLKVTAVPVAQHCAPTTAQRCPPEVSFMAHESCLHRAAV